MRTRESLVYRAAKFLGKVIAGEALQPVEYQTIDDEIPSVIANMNSRGVTYLPDYDEFEDDVFDPLARVIAAKVCPDFGMSLANIAGFEGEPMRSEAELRVLRRDPSTKEVIRFVNF